MIKYPQNEAANLINKITGCTVSEARRIVALIIMAIKDPSVMKCKYCYSPFPRNLLGDKVSICEHCRNEM